MDFTISLTGGQRGAQFAKTGESKNIYEITTPSGRKLMPADGRCWAASEDRYKELLAENRIWFGKTGNNVPAQKKFLTEVQSGIVSKTIWFRKEVGDNQEAKKEVKAVNASEIFATPKPERLIERILTLATDNNDIILDSFLGSGTTTAVAHKMNRKWIGIELGDHAYTHCLPRMKKVVDGLDEGGISKSQNWKGGGGFRFYNLAPSLLKKDDFGNWIIEPDYNADMLAAAMAKHEGYHYSPDEQLFWKQGQSTEQDFIFTTTQFVTLELLDKIHEQMQEGESLLICCKSFQAACENKYENINVKKIPVMLLGRCEFGKDDYSLNIISMPTDENEEPFVPAAQIIAEEKEAEDMRKQGKQSTLFD